MILNLITLFTLVSTETAEFYKLAGQLYNPAKNEPPPDEDFEEDEEDILFDDEWIVRLLLLLFYFVIKRIR